MRSFLNRLVHVMTVDQENVTLIIHKHIITLFNSSETDSQLSCHFHHTCHVDLPAKSGSGRKAGSDIKSRCQEGAGEEEEANQGQDNCLDHLFVWNYL